MVLQIDILIDQGLDIFGLKLRLSKSTADLKKDFLLYLL